MEAFSVITRLTKKEYSKIVLHKTYKLFYVRILTIAGALMFLTAILELSHVIHMYEEIPFFQLVFGLFVIILPLLTISRSNKLYNANRNLQNDITYTFTDDTVNVRTINYETTYKWSNIIKIEKFESHMLLYSGKNVADIIEISKLSKEQLDFIELSSKST